MKMKAIGMMKVLGVALVALTGVLAWADETTEEVVAYGESGLWLGPDEILVAYGETDFKLVVFRDLPANPTEADIRAAIEAAHMKDQERILAQVGGSADRYSEFQQWAAEIGELDVANSAYAGYSFALGVEELFENEPEVSFADVAVSAVSPVTLDVAVEVMDGEMSKSVSSAKVSEMFEATSDVTNWTPVARIVPQVIDRTKAVSTPVEFTITPGDSKSDSAFFRVNVSLIAVKPQPPQLGGVQLWENGPYWAECNVGASKPEEYGYYFWWGDTIGYKREGGTWAGDHYEGVTWVSSTGEHMSSSPFDFEICPTYDVDKWDLQEAGYIDSTGNLVAEHDAATVHLGAPWRMPTDKDFKALVEKCTTTWITTNGVTGRLVTGKGTYASKSIFLPAAGGGYGFGIYGIGANGNCWSSTPNTTEDIYAWYLHFYSGDFMRSSEERSYGQSVRPVREFTK